MTTTAFPTSYPEDIVLEKPNLERGKNIIKTLSLRQSSREFSDKSISLNDLSDLLWAANGVNREDGKRTAPSAMNEQEITVYAFIKNGAYKYDYENHILKLVESGDYRKLVFGKQEYETSAELLLVYVADVNKLRLFRAKALQIASMDAGIVSQNVNLFCASVGLMTIPRITMDVNGITELLKLSEHEVPLMNNAVGYPVQ